jgi:hypothetical protein
MALPWSGHPRVTAIITWTFLEETLMKSTLLTLGLLMATHAFADTAASGNPGNPANLGAVDTDGDHQISLAEAQAGAPQLASRFNDIDADRNGFLSVDEVLANQAVGPFRVRRDMRADFAAADANADGLLTRAEADGKMPIVSDLFDEMDANEDGSVSQDEIHDHARKHGPVLFIREGIAGSAKE